MIQCEHHKSLGWIEEDCITCKSLQHHDSIYGGLSNEEGLALWKKRIYTAFSNANVSKKKK